MFSAIRSPPRVFSSAARMERWRATGASWARSRRGRHSAPPPPPPAFFDQLVGVLPHGAIDEAEQAGDLLIGPSPVLLAEHVQRQHLEAEIRSGLDDGSDG